MSRGTPEPRSGDVSTREAILEAATVLFADLGYTRASLALVADRLGVTRQAFYYHFSTKGDILAALFDRAMSLVDAELQRRLVVETDSRYLEMLSGHMQVVLDNLDLIKITIHDRPSIDQLGINNDERRAAYARTLMRAFREEVTSGHFAEGHPRLVVQSNLAMINGLCTWWQPGRPAAATVHAKMLELLHHGLVA